MHVADALVLISIYTSVLARCRMRAMVKFVLMLASGSPSMKKYVLRKMKLAAGGGILACSSLIMSARRRCLRGIITCKAQQPLINCYQAVCLSVCLFIYLKSQDYGDHNKGA